MDTEGDITTETIDLRETSPWDGWVDVYLEWHEAENIPDGPFYAALRAEHPGFVVEVGCGDGRLFAPVRPDVGIDTSPAMLARARARHGDAVDLRLADVRTFVLERPASMIYAPLNVMQHLPTHEAQRVALENIRRNLAPDGVLAMDCLCATEAVIAERNARVLLRHRTDRFAVFTTTRRVGPMAIVWHAFVDEIGPDGIVTGRRYLPEVPINVRAPSSWRDLAEACGFVVEQHSEDFDGTPAHDGSPWQVLVLRNPA